METSRNITDEILLALTSNGLRPIRNDMGPFTEIRVIPPDASLSLGREPAVTFIIIDRFATSVEEAEGLSSLISSRLDSLRRDDRKAMVIPADLWIRRREATLWRMLAHCGVFSRIFARNCESRRIRKPETDAFMNTWHSYGTALCRNRYGLFTTKDTVLCSTRDTFRETSPEYETANSASSNRESFPKTSPWNGAAFNSRPGANVIPAGTLVAAAEFSNMRRRELDGREIRSYEWVRYASLPYVRVDGGMGKILRKFIDEVRPDDVMSYADLEWSDGAVYRKLGFREDGRKPPVLFAVDPESMSRIPLSGSRKVFTSPQYATDLPADRQVLYYSNFGSIRYRLAIQWNQAR